MPAMLRRAHSDRGWTDTGQSRSVAQEHTARLRDPDTRQHGNHGWRWQYPAEQRGTERIRHALGTRRPRRYLRLYRLSHQHVLRLSVGETDRAFGVARLRRG